MRRRRSVASVAGGLLGALVLTALVVGLRPLRAQRGVPDPPTLPAEPKAARPSSPPAESQPPTFADPQPLTAPPATTPPVAPADGPFPPVYKAPEDPEKAANDFVLRTRREATAAVKSLQEEAATLRARLQKVESALQRWQGVIAALDARSEGPGPTVLEPAPPEARPSGPELPAPELSTPEPRVPGTVRLPFSRETAPEGAPSPPPADATQPR